MSCTAPSLTIERRPSETRASSTSRDNDETATLLRRSRGRRHSYDTFRPRASSICNADAVILRVDLFLNELKRRLDRLEKYRQESVVHFDAQLERGYHALRDVRDSCSSFPSSEVLWGAARHRATLLVDILETHYNDVMPTRETFEQKAQASMRLMEAYLTELETRAHTSHKYILESTWRRVDESLSATSEMINTSYDKAVHAKVLLQESIAHALSRARESTLIHYTDLPLPWRGNPHILKGYRFNATPSDCIRSIFRFSNETINIWSHFIGFLLVVSVALFIYPTSSTYPLSSPSDILISAIFFLAACKCLICSTMWHTMNSIAIPDLHSRFACVDYSGIAFLVAASILSTEWTAFYCEPMSRTLYMSLTVILGVAGSILPWRASFNRNDMAWFRVVFYLTLGATGFAPVLQLNYTRGYAWTYYFYAPITKSLCVYVLGAVVYALQIPEKWWPGMFDYVGGSHNIWHVAVLGGIWFHYRAMGEFFEGAFKRAGEEGCCMS